MAAALPLAVAAAVAVGRKVDVVLPNTAPGPATGRVRVYLSRTNRTEPRTQCSDNQDTSQVFGVDAFELSPGAGIAVTERSIGYPVHGLGEVPAGEYYVQAELFPYDLYSRGDGEKLFLPKSCVNPAGNDGSYGSPAGTRYSAVKEVFIGDGSSLSLSLDFEVPVKPGPGCSGKGADTEYIKTVNVLSPRLSKFWGRNITIQACVLLPYGFNEHPDARYPLVIAQGHYSATWNAGGRFDNTPPNPDTPGYAYVDQLYANYLYGNWTDPNGVFKGARMLVVTLNHDVPFFDDSYAVNSENVGPYGDAIMKELLPEVERRYRGIGEGWARGLFGGSTGGWESIGVQVLYPDDFNGAYAACPDPVSFTSYTTVNIYEDSNAYWYDAPFKRTARPGVRDAYSGQTVIPGTRIPTYGHPYGQTSATVEEMNRREVVLGGKSRSCGQWDIWEAVFGPKGVDGYPERIWCKDPSGLCEYGKINKTTAAYWKEHFDLLHIMKRDWASGLGKKLAGKIHLFVGGSDTFFLTNAVMDMQDFLESTTSPPYGGSVTIGTHGGRGFEHCFNGYLPDGSVAPNSVTRELYNQKFVPLLAERFAATAPAGANMRWRSY
eukprot:TRINITY_DN472_c2_g1_i1.p1 TRINITY_DN472_c2_g1~~TRINITY_DN472_c2_g1_i1.p1  ORF type:complete len:604 (+),score=128.84 TRINITY_DN472_c2_g1_i1:55-1866(+)